jgi:chemosensory pili system protein ChpA (sensor histidine kinase/response regulator)
MSNFSPEILSGLLAQSLAYVQSIRRCLSASASYTDAAQITESLRLVQVVSSGAQMLGLMEIADCSASLKAKLEAVVANGATGTQHSEISAALDALEILIRQAQPSEQGALPAASTLAAVPAPARVSDIPDELMGVFSMEASEHFESIQRSLETLRHNPGDVEALSEMRRVTHTLKGAAASVGFTQIARLAHSMEDLLEQQIETGDRLSTEIVEILIDSADMLEMLMNPGTNPEQDALLKSLNERYAQLLGADHPALEAPETAGDALSAASHGVASENILRLPLSRVDTLINHVGEIVINRAVSEGHMSSLRTLLSELAHSTRRLKRVARDIDTQIESTAKARNNAFNPEFATFDPLELDRYTLLHQFTRELEEVTADADDVNGKLNFLAEDFDAVLRTERRLTRQLQDGLLATRLVSFREVETRLRRIVQRTAATVGKSVELNVQGFDTEVDKTILNALIDPLTHLLRNAVDHGTETPAERARSGKTPTAQITLNVRRERSRVILTLSDDGYGIDPAKVRQRARAENLLSTDDQRSVDDLLDLLFVEGFSLAESVSETSGRGLGLNIVRRAVSQLQGTIHIDTALRRGTTFVISVPVTLAITRSLYVVSGSQSLAIPLEQISAVMRLEPELMDEIRKERVLHDNGRVLAVYDLAEFIGGTDDIDQRRYGLVIEAGAQATIVLVDALSGTGEAVVKSLGNHLKRVHGISGATISGDGNVVLILDLIELTTGSRSTAHAADSLRSAQTVTSAGLHVMVVDDSLSVRRVVTGFLEREGWSTTQTKDGIDALEKLATLRPDVMLIDIEMPRMNGYELLSRIRSDDSLRSIPVVFLTSRSAAKHRERAMQLGANGYLVKPYREEQLISELTRVVKESTYA